MAPADADSDSTNYSNSDWRVGEGLERPWRGKSTLKHNLSGSRPTTMRRRVAWPRGADFGKGAGAWSHQGRHHNVEVYAIFRSEVIGK